jgi:DNA-binding CsgD family transcriptional regulator
MRSIWTVDAPPAGQTFEAGAVMGLLEAGDDQSPARTMLDFINCVAPVQYISLVEYVGGAPVQVEGHSRGLRNITSECFALYKERFRQADELTRVASRMRDQPVMHGPVTAFLYSVSDIPDPAWREQIFISRKLTGRLSFLYSPVPKSLFAINLYRDEREGIFEEADVLRLLGLSPLLKRAHRNALLMNLASPDQVLRTAEIERALQRTAQQLSLRERQVCARIACGVGADGIAAELQIAVSTVMTLRKRAYAKLSIHGKQQLARFIH